MPATRKLQTRFPCNRVCKLGTFKFIYNEKVINSTPELKRYIKEDLGVTDISQIIGVCKRAYEVRENRNKAAHGTYCLSYEDAMEARNLTYIEEINNTKGLILEFLNMINPVRVDEK